MKRRKTNQQISDELLQAASDALQAIVDAVCAQDFGMLLGVEAALTDAYDKAIIDQPSTAADRIHLARQALRTAIKQSRAHD